MLLIAIAAVVALTAYAALVRHFARLSNTHLNRFDAIIVLGTPADSDGNPTPRELARVTEAVQEYERNVAPRIIFTGGAAHNQFVEAEVMARAAEAQGIPDSAIFKETESKNTIQNACFATRMMKAHGWRSAEVISSAVHLPRASMIFTGMTIEFRAHAAPPLAQASADGTMEATGLEILKTVHFLVYGRWVEQCRP
ncbi:MAG TPA: YdcF family protein [Terracidiphilus sp.]|nr:YdcF family protein [Terracidiphilus sp.]